MNFSTIMHGANIHIKNLCYPFRLLTSSRIQDMMPLEASGYFYQQGSRLNLGGHSKTTWTREGGWVGGQMSTLLYKYA